MNMADKIFRVCVVCSRNIIAENADEAIDNMENIVKGMVTKGKPTDMMSFEADEMDYIDKYFELSNDEKQFLKKI